MKIKKVLLSLFVTIIINFGANGESQTKTGKYLLVLVEIEEMTSENNEH